MCALMYAMTFSSESFTEKAIFAFKQNGFLCFLLTLKIYLLKEFENLLIQKYAEKLLKDINQF